jgi:hypothetical protein
MASSGDVPGAQAAAATLAPFWDSARRTRTPEERGRVSGLFGKALRAADAGADAETGAMLLRPFRIENLADAYVDSFAKIAGGYGQQWTAELLRTWFGGKHTRHCFGIYPGTSGCGDRAGDVRAARRGGAVPGRHAR